MTITKAAAADNTDQERVVIVARSDADCRGVFEATTTEMSLMVQSKNCMHKVPGDRTEPGALFSSLQELQQRAWTNLGASLGACQRTSLVRSVHRPRLHYIYI